MLADRGPSPALILADGAVISYATLYRRSQRVAALLHDAGLRPGDGVALVLPNCPEFFEIAWGAQRAGIIYTAISSRLTATEVDYIVGDCGAKLFITSRYLADKAAELAPLLKGVLALARAARPCGPAI